MCKRQIKRSISVVSAFLLAVVISLGLTACSDNDDNGYSNPLADASLNSRSTTNKY